MNQGNNLMAILALGTVLVLAAVAVAPGVAYGQLINAEIANVDYEQEQKSELDPSLGYSGR